MQIEVLSNLLLLTFYFPGAKLLLVGHARRFHFLSSLEFHNDFSHYSFLDLVIVLILASVHPAQIENLRLSHRVQRAGHQHVRLLGPH